MGDRARILQGVYNEGKAGAACGDGVVEERSTPVVRPELLPRVQTFRTDGGVVKMQIQIQCQTNGGASIVNNG